MRCFVAVWPPAEAASQLERVVDAMCAAMPNARRVATTNLHLTLAFIGSLAPQDAHRLAAALRDIDDKAFPSYTWTLDRIGRFDRTRVLMVGGESTSVLESYADTVRSMLKRLAVPFDSHPFVPHMTLLRNVGPGLSMSQPRFSVPWPLARPRLMQSIGTANGVRYAAVE